jgi:proteasome lid subunit RPN8/RPN11
VGARVTIALDAGMHGRLLPHLLPVRGRYEEAAFVLARTERGGEGATFRAVELILLGPEWFEVRSPVYLELTDACRGMVIKRAHDLNASLIEFHSHPGSPRASFSWSDLSGFREFVPHVWWRLKGRPYAAVVVAPDSFDAVAWVDGPAAHVPVTELHVGDRGMRPTGYTINNWESIDDSGPI